MTYTAHSSIHVTLGAFALVGALAGCGGDPPGDATTGSTGATEASASATDPTGGSTNTPTTGDDPTGSDTTVGDPTGSDTTAGTDPMTAGDPSTGGSTTGGQAVWQLPACNSVTGTGAVTFSADQGATLAPMDQMIVPVTYTWGLVALGKPGALVANSEGKILASDDAGCTWHPIGTAEGSNAGIMHLRVAGDTRAYGFGDNGDALIRVDDEQVTQLPSPAGQNGLLGLGVDPNDPDRVRVGDGVGQIWESTDAGQKFAPIGAPLFNDLFTYRVAFDPQDIDHIVVGALGDGALVSFDGGAKWTPAKGLGPGKANGFNVVVSPADGNVVWVEGLDLADPNEATSRHIWRSTDGGLNFTAVVDAADATLYNGNHMFPHPVDTNVLYFVFGSNYGNYGTDLYRYDHADATISVTHNKWHDTVVAFSPADPSFLYLGLSIEPLGG